MKTTEVPMAFETKTALIESWFENLWNNGDVKTIERLFAKDGIAHGVGPEPLTFDQFIGAYQMFRGAMPNMRTKIVNTVEQGNLVAVHFKATMDERLYSLFGEITRLHY